MCIKPKMVTHLGQATSLMVSHLFLLPWCTAIAGYQISSNNSNSQQQPTAVVELCQLCIYTVMSNLLNSLLKLT